MKKVIILTLAISLIVAGIAFATVISSKHDMRASLVMGAQFGRTITAANSVTTQVCVFCHHPHRGSSSVATTLLWNINAAVASFTTYTSVTMNATDGGDSLTPGATSGSNYSLLCMGCHDGGGVSNTFVKGQAADGSLGSFPNLKTGIANLGSSLSDDHPVDFTYPTTGLGDIQGKVGDTVATIYPLYSGTMQCATCHDVHNGTSRLVEFMRGSTDIITDSKICRDCHTNK